MVNRQMASEYFEEVVTPAIDELIDEYNQREGYRTGYCPDPILFRDNPPVAEHNGISVTFPNGTEKNVSVCWFEGTDKIVIGRIDAVIGGTKSFIFEKTDKEYLKDRIRELIRD